LLDSKLVQVSLDDQPEYWALSYVWGDASVREEIQINGHNVSITTNLLSALEHIADSLGSGDQDEIFLWVDAICINQDDMTERSEQVQLMRSIYQQASMTIAWLGRGTVKDLPAMAALSLMSSPIETLRENNDLNSASWLHDFPALCEQHYNAQEVAGSSTGNIYWDAIDEILKNIYWTRTWTLQEVVLSTDLVFMCGPFTISEIDLQLFFDWVNSIQSRPPRKPDGMDPWLWIWISNAGFLALTKANIFMSLRKNSFLGLKFLHKHAVLFARKLQATDPRDKLYGVLGIADTHSTVDYSITTKQVYCQFSKSWMMEDQKLNLLSYAGIGIFPEYENPHDLPSWTPDWHSISKHDVPFFELYDHSDLSDAFAQKEEWNLKYSFRVEEGVLRVHGVLFDEIVKTMGFPKSESLSLFCSEILKDTCNSYPTGIPALQAIFHVLLADKADPTLPKKRKPILQGTDSFFNFAIAFINTLVPAQGVHDPVKWEALAAEHLTGLFGIETDHRFAESVQKQFLGPGVACPSSWNGMSVAKVIAIDRSTNGQFYFGALHMAMGATGSRLFFRTKNGYLGVGPPGMQTTDIVSSLIGCKYPVVLRRQGSHFLLVGVCFISGLMYGEAFTGFEDGNVKIEEFELH